MRLRILLVCCAALALSVGVAAAMAGNGNGGNSDAAKACQKDGWKNLVRSDGKAFKNPGDCVSYAAQGGTLKPCGGSEDWSGFAAGSIPTTFAGGTIEGPYGPDNLPFHNAGIDYSFHILYTGLTSVPFRLTFTSPVKSVQMDLQGGSSSAFQTRTLKAYDSSNNLVGTDSPAVNAVGTVSVTSPTNTNTIKYFTLEDSDGLGTFVIDIVWSCAA